MRRFFGGRAEANEPRPFLMGSETEYAVSGRTAGKPLPTAQVHDLLLEALRRERLWLPEPLGTRGMYLENGSRFYLDTGDHPEYATPECTTPAQVARYDKAGERLLELARARVVEEHPGHEVTVLKNNLSPVCPDQVTWATHESYTCWVPVAKAAEALIPHLVSRIVYAGAGCLSAAPEGCGFELSQRARHLVAVQGDSTTDRRSIFGTRQRGARDGSARKGWARAHLLGKDSQRAPFGTYLTFGTTGLLFLLVNAGRRVGKGLQLADPVRALGVLSRDPRLRARVPLADGRSLTALEIQESYLAECEAGLPGGDFPPWAQEVLGHWRQTLAALADDPLRLARQLDPYWKLLAYGDQLRRARYTWADLRQGLGDLATLRRTYVPEVVRAVLAEDPAGLSVEGMARFPEAIASLAPDRPGRLDRLRLAVRLSALDLRYHEVGGLYDGLTATGHVQGVVVGPADVEAATREAPPQGRAAVRGQCIKDLQQGGWLCEWRYLCHLPSGDFIDLRNPFGHELRRAHWPGLLDENPKDEDLAEIAYQLRRR
jgi:hypothetical protein